MSIPQHITQLIRLETLCKDWSSIHSHSCEFFSSLVNILTQREATTNILHNRQQKVDDNDDGVADISISLTNLYISDIVQMYEKELIYKRNLLFGGVLKINHFEEKINIKSGINGVKLINERWVKQSYINFEIEEGMIDRLKIWKRIREFEQLNKT
ncbi:11321_t:CDS:2 [Diversispora eburnea]|uniref:11321_t:CDS:1 n=1 Tax=Diversispora eburnea TaxID=1213867 RepID=A0A9N9FR34_9GLOM|nr:11321_t:CDS:2 [Diversispora eburnea]